MIEQHASPDRPILSALGRYAQTNPLAVVAGAAIVGMLLARFAFLRNSRD